MKIFTGNANPKLAQQIARHLRTRLGEAEVGHFPDGETFIKIKENVRGQDVFAIQSVAKPPNEHLMELLIMIDALRRASASRITAVLPFYGYARQDRKDQPRVPITAKLVANLLVAAGANRILTMDLHAQQIQGFFDIPVDHLYAAPVIVQYLRSKRIENPVVVSPDAGGVNTAYAYSTMLQCGLAIVAKRRRNPTDIQALSVVGDVSGRSAIMVDDLVTTAGTLCAAASILQEHGAKEIYAAVTHAVLTDTAMQRLRQSSIKELIVTDTVAIKDACDFNVTVLSISKLLAEAIRRIHVNQSVSSLFKL